MRHPRRSPALGGLLDDLEAARAGRVAARGQRTLATARGVDWTSNDYLGLSRDPALGEAIRAALEEGPPFGAPSSRLLRGELRCHRALERRLAAFKGTEAAQLFSTGYQANLGTLGALVGPGDRVLSDARNHASLIDGLRLARCRRVVYPHVDLDGLARRLAEPHPGGRTWVVTETLFSMDGDVAPLDRIADLADAHGALLVLDEAHATGLFGERGAGLAERFGVTGRAAAIVSTFGKAFGFFGAFAAGPRPVIDAIVNGARSLIFTTAPPPVVVAGIGAALDLVQTRPELRQRVHHNALRVRRGLRERGVEVPDGEGPIVPVLLGSAPRAVAVADFLRRRGIDARAIRPPTVAPGTERLRISVHADRTAWEIDQLCDAVAAALLAHPPGATSDDALEVEGAAR